MFKGKHFALALAALPLASAASAAGIAAAYDLVDDFGAAVFSYGSGNYSGATPGFTPFTFAYNDCFNMPGLSCVTSGPSGAVPGSSNLPGVGHGDGALHFITVDVPAGTLWTHPGNTPDTDAVIRFTATAAGTYTLTGAFSRQDNMTSGSNDPGNNGVLAGIFLTSGGATTNLFTATPLQGYNVVQGASAGYDLSLSLGAGDVISWVVANNGNYYNDSTGITGSIGYTQANDAVLVPVPEPASWALMLGGFGLVGAALRTSRRPTRSIA